MNFSYKNIFLIFLFVINNLVYADKIAVATKIKGVVEIMKVGNKEFKNLRPGSILSDGDKIRTGSSGFTSTHAPIVTSPISVLLVVNVA